MPTPRSAPTSGSARTTSSVPTPGPARPSRAYGEPSPRPSGEQVPPRRRPPGRTPILAPAAALLGLFVVGGASFWGISLLGLDLDELSGRAAAVATPDDAGPAASGRPPASSTPDADDLEPSIAPFLVTPPPNERPTVKGTILFTRDGDIWAASGLQLEKLTDKRSDSSPTWTHDGKSIYFIRTTARTTSDARPGGKYTLYVPDVLRMNADGSRRKKVYEAIIKSPSGPWFSHVLQLDASPDGRTLALVSDGPDGSGPVILHTLATKGGRLEAVKVRTIGDLGHNDPEWSPDGRRIAYTHNHRDGTVGDPVIAIFTCKSRRDCGSGKASYLRPGYAKPSWSPDGSWFAAERTTGNGRDIVILDADRGDERARLTKDGDSFAPVVSPDGGQIAYLHRDGVGIDLRIMTLSLGDDGSITLLDDRAVTDDGSIDAGSTPAWFIPADELTLSAGPGPSIVPEPASAAEAASDTEAASPADDPEAVPLP